jgi:hypothetical protein
LILQFLQFFLCPNQSLIFEFTLRRLLHPTAFDGLRYLKFVFGQDVHVMLGNRSGDSALIGGARDCVGTWSIGDCFKLLFMLSGQAFFKGMQLLGVPCGAGDVGIQISFDLVNGGGDSSLLLSSRTFSVCSAIFLQVVYPRLEFLLQNATSIFAFQSDGWAYIGKANISRFLCGLFRGFAGSLRCCQRFIPSLDEVSLFGLPPSLRRSRGCITTCESRGGRRKPFRFLREQLVPFFP